MKTKRSLIAVSAGVVTLAATLVYAAPQWRGDMMGMMGGPGMMSGQGMMGGPGMMHGQGGMGGGQMMGQGMGPNQILARLQELEKALQLREDQRAPWESFKSVVERQAKSMIDHHQQMLSRFSQAQSMTLPERVALHKEMMGERFASMALFTNALTEFYGQLDSAQQKVMDQHPLMGGM